MVGDIERNQQYPAQVVGKDLTIIHAASRPERSIEDEWKSVEQQKTVWTSMLLRPEAREELKKLETRAEKLKERERLEKEEVDHNQLLLNRLIPTMR